MPILNDILDHKVLGREYKRGLQKGIRRSGVLQGILTISRLVIEKRFGAMPAWAEESLARRTAAELEDLSERLLDVPSLEDLLK